MDKVLNQRKWLLTTLIALAITVHFLVFDMVLPKILPTTDGSRFLKFLLSGGLLYSLIVLAPLWFYDKFLWRLLNPQFDLSGTWEVSVENIWSLNKDHITPAGFVAIKHYEDILQKNSGMALICQTPFRAHVQEAIGFSAISPESGLSTWTAEIVNVNLPGKLSVVFESSANGGEFSGRDSLVVSKRDWRGRPLEMAGDAIHVIKHLDITVKGTIRYRRVTRNYKPNATGSNNAMQPTAK